MLKIMNSRKEYSQSGFALIEGLVVVLILVIIGFGGYYVWHTQHNSKSTTSATTTSTKSTISSKTTTSTNTIATTTPNPYAGWKTYCDKSTGGCFQYPASWTEQNYSQCQNSCYTDVIFSSTTKTVQVEYMSPDNSQAVAGPVEFYMHDTTTTTKPNPSQTIIGGYYQNNLAAYYLIDSSLIQKYALKVSQFSSSLSGDLVFTDKVGSTQSKLTASQVLPNGQTQTQTQENAWFSSSDAKTALLVMKSFYFQ